MMKLSIKKRTNKAKIAEIQKIASTINDALGEEGKIYLGSEHIHYERVPTGIIAIDYILGGGLPRGMLVQFTGGDSCFKTTAATIAIANEHKRDPDSIALWVAGEGFDKKWAFKWGIDPDRVLIISANTGDVSMEAALTALETGTISIGVFDSYQSLGTARELENSVEKEAYGNSGAGQMWGRVMRRSFAAMSKCEGKRPALIGISQVRAAIGKWSPTGTPEPEGTGIWALKHWKAADIYFRKGELYFDGKEEDRVILGRQFKVRCLKNKTAPAERVSSFDMMYGEKGKPYIDNLPTTIRLAKALGYIEGSGAWLEGYDIRTQGEKKFLAEVRKDKALIKQITKDVLEAAGI